MPEIDVMYDAFPRSRAAFVACGPPLDTFRRANTAVQHSQRIQETLDALQQRLRFLCEQLDRLLSNHAFNSNEFSIFTFNDLNAIILHFL